MLLLVPVSLQAHQSLVGGATVAGQVLAALLY